MALINVLGKTLFLIALLLGTCLPGLVGCSSTPEDYDPDYHQNLFYSGFMGPPNHERKAHVDFFDKECSGSSGQDFSCHFTDH